MEDTIKRKILTLKCSNLLGEVIFDEEETNFLIDKSSRIIRLYDPKFVQSYEMLIITITIINIGKKWCGDESGFWEFVHKSISIERTQQTQNFLYLSIRKSFENELNRELFETASGKNSYYSTILAHALSPKDTIISLIDLLYSVYMKSLLEFYIKGDVVSIRITNELKRRILSTSQDMKEGLDIGGIFYSLKSSLRYLILYESDIFTNLIDRVLCFFSDIQNTDDEESYLLSILKNWKLKNSVIVARNIERSDKVKETVSDFGKLILKYSMKSGKLSLVIPHLRLDNYQPTSVYECIYSYSGKTLHINLVTFGNALLMNLKTFTISIDSRSLVANSIIDLNIKILEKGDIIFDSKDVLFRKAVVFKNEIEIQGNYLKQGFYQIFTTYTEDIEHTRDIDYQGLYFYSLLFGQDSYLIVGGDEWYLFEERANKSVGVNIDEIVGLTYSDIKYKEIKVIRKFRSFSIENAEQEFFNDLRLHCNEKEFIIKPNSNFKEVLIKYERLAPIFCEDGIKTIAFVNNSNSNRLYVNHFYVATEINVDFIPRVFFGKNRKVIINGKTKNIDTSSSFIEFDYFTGILKLEFPILNWNLDGKYWLSSTSDVDVWYEDLTGNSVIDLSCFGQGNDSLQLFVGDFNIEHQNGHYRIGEKVLSQINHLKSKDSVIVSVKIQGIQASFDLFELLFSEQFIGEPYLEKDGNILYWSAVDNHKGKTNPKFLVMIFNEKNSYEFSADLYNEIELENFIDEFYSFRVYRESEEIFQTNRVLVYEAENLLLGNEYMNRFVEKNIALKKASMSGENKRGKLYDYEIQNLEYIQCNGFPEFAGILRNVKNSNQYEKVWVTIRDHGTLWIQKVVNDLPGPKFNYDVKSSTLTLKNPDNCIVQEISYLYYQEVKRNV